VIDFRYHLVSLIAVFLAVALGIVIGTTALNAPILDDLEGEVAALTEDKRELETQTQELQAQLDSGDAFEAAVAPTLVTLPETDNTGQLVGSLLAQVLMRPTAPGAAAPDTAALSSVLAGLRALGVLEQDSPSVAPADFAVVLTAGAPPEEDAEQRTDTLVDLALALDAAGSGAVVAGDAASARDTGLVGVLRSDPENSAAVSTVDNVESPSGRISTVLALGRESQGTSGAYGTGEDAQPVPPLPTATP
jgi:hypothetical protein